MHPNKITSEQSLSDPRIFFSSFATILLPFSFYVWRYGCQEEGSWESWASLVAWKMMMLLLKSNTLQSLESGQTHQHLVPMPGLQGEQSAYSDGEAGHFPGHHVWCGTQAAFPEYRSSPPALGSHRPASECVPCRVSSPSEWTSKKMALWSLVFISYIWPVLSPPDFTNLLSYKVSVSLIFS